MRENLLRKIVTVINSNLFNCLLNLYFILVLINLNIVNKTKLNTKTLKTIICLNELLKGLILDTYF